MRAWTIGLSSLCALLSLGCGASSFAHLTGLRSAEREPTATWTAVVTTDRSGADEVALARIDVDATGVEQASLVTLTDSAAEGHVPVLPARLEGAARGQFTLLTYNVAGLPEMVSPSRPRANIPLVSPLLNRYDVALVQEDFSYHHELIHSTLHPFRSRPMRPRSFVADGLNQFSRFGFPAVHRVRWEHCNGIVSSATDCLADKGFTYSDLELAPNVHVHLYNLHADAGSGRLDIETRRQNFEQLTHYIERHSQGQALIVAGDTNLRASSNRGDAATLTTFIETLGLSDACDAQVTPEEQIDRVLYRPSSTLELTAPRCWQATEFVDSQGEGLSDHPAIGVSMRWLRAQPEPLMAHRVEL